MEKKQEAIKYWWLDNLIYRALKNKDEVKLYIDKEYYIGIKINNKKLSSGFPWEMFEEEIDPSGNTYRKWIKKYYSKIERSKIR